MRKLVIALATFAASASFAATDKGTEFKFGGEIRTRYENRNNYNLADTGPKATNSDFVQRSQFHVNALSGDKFQAYFNLLAADRWGSAATPTPGTASTASLQEVWAWWKTSDMFSVKWGRMWLNYGDGQVIASSEYAQIPNTYEGVVGRLTWDFLDLDVLGLKLVDLNSSGVAVPPAAVQFNDQEVNLYGLYGSLKNLPDVLKSADVYVLFVNGDTTAAGFSSAFPSFSSGAANTWNLVHYGIRARGEAAIVDYRAEVDAQSGKLKSITAGVGDQSQKGLALQAEVGVNLPEFMKARVFGRYFTASGNDSTQTGAAPDIGAYQPLFFDNHCVHGCMDIAARSNLTDITLGATVMPTEATTVGLGAHLLSRTTEKDGYTLNGTNFAFAAANTDKAIGTEIDVWAEHAYGNGFTMLASFGTFSAGQFIKTAAGGASLGSAMKLTAQAKYAF